MPYSKYFNLLFRFALVCLAALAGSALGKSVHSWYESGAINWVTFFGSIVLELMWLCALVHMHAVMLSLPAARQQVLNRILYPDIEE
jgi:hypothetical protein